MMPTELLSLSADQIEFKSKINCKLIYLENIFCKDSNR